MFSIKIISYVNLRHPYNISGFCLWVFSMHLLNKRRYVFDGIKADRKTKVKSFTEQLEIGIGVVISDYPANNLRNSYKI